MHYTYGTNPPRSGMSFEEWCASEDRFEWSLHKKYVENFRAVKTRIVSDN